MDLFGALFLSISLAAGVSPNSSTVVSEDASHVRGGLFLVDDETWYYNDFSAEVSLEDRLVFVGFSQHNEATKADSYTFAPMQSTYTVTAGVSLAGVEVGFLHFCTHPNENMIDGDLVAGSIFKSADNFYVKYSAKFKIN